MPSILEGTLYYHLSRMCHLVQICTFPMVTTDETDILDWLEQQESTKSQPRHLVSERDRFSGGITDLLALRFGCSYSSDLITVL